MIRFNGLLGLAAGGLICAQGYSAERAAPDFKEVYDIIANHLTGATPEELNSAAVNGLLSGLSPRVLLITNEPSSSTATSAPVVLKTNLFEGDIAYVRVGRVGEGLAAEVHNAFEHLETTNKPKGIVLDLRYAGGEDYSAAAATADLFVKKKEPLLKWGSGSASSTEKANAITVPVAAVVNGATADAAEALAAVIRHTGAGLIIGGRTSGRAMVSRDFPLKNGDKLRIGTARIEVGDNSTIAADGVKPDIAVQVPAEEERAYYADAFKLMPSPTLMADAGLSITNQGQLTSTNRNRRPRFNEAELVRERKEGVNLDADTESDRAAETDRPVVHDPALARALDLLKGLAVVRHTAH
jgi:carboxyl-terminal processing protease